MAFRLLNVAGRAALARDDSYYDLEALAGDFSSCPMAAISRFADLSAIDLDAAEPTGSISALDRRQIGPPVPRPGKAFGIGLNYRAHAEESGMDLPEVPLVFAKYPNCICGPFDDVCLRGDRVDYEIEMVVVIGTNCRDVASADAWSHVAGVTGGQDISDRALQFAAKPPQFGLAKSFDTYGPIGPELVSIAALEAQGIDRNAIGLRCEINGEERQNSSTDDLIFSVPDLVAALSHVATLEPGDLIFTGTPSGVGLASKRYLKPGDGIGSWIEGVGTMSNRCVDDQGEAS